MIYENQQQWDLPTCNQKAREFLNDHWRSLDDKLSFVGGKEFITELVKYYRERFHVSLTYRLIMDQMTPEFIPEEVKALLDSLNK